MTQFGPPPLPAAYAPALPQRSSPPPWSAAAIGGFVLSLLGFVGITAVLGVIFGVIGIFATRGGKRRGMGLAIAAIPISLVTGAFAALIVFAGLMFARMVEVPQKLQSVFVSGDVASQANRLRTSATSDWNQAISDDALQGWLNSVRQKHGTLIGLKVDMSKTATTPRGEMQILAKGKFVNGETMMRFTFSAADPWDVRLTDIEVDGASPLRPTPSTSEPSDGP